MSHTIRTAVFGLGRGAAVHVPAIQAHPRFELAAVASSRPGRAAEVAEQRKVPRACNDWREAIADPQIDLVVVTSAAAARGAQAEAAVAAGKHVLVEPPLSGDAEERDALLTEAERSHRVAASCLPLRYLPARQALRELIVGGHLGAVHHAAWRHLSIAWHAVAPVHAVDTLRWMLGAIESEGVQRAGTDDALFLQLRHAGGCTSQLAIDGRSATDDFSFLVAGTQRAALLVGDHPDACELHVLEGEIDDEYALRPSPYQRFAAANLHVPPLMELLDDLAAAIDGRPTALPTLTDAAEAQRIVGEIATAGE